MQVAEQVLDPVECGYLEVPEDRANPDRTIRVWFGRIESPQATHEDPVLVVGEDLGVVPAYGGIAPLARRVGRDVIILDGRGIGRSEPTLECPEVDALASEALGVASDDTGLRGEFLLAVGACHDRLAAVGVDPAAYHLEAMAADAADLRRALGIPRWNVISYGTSSRIATELARQDPDGVRALVLDSPEVVGADPRLVAATFLPAALDRLLQDCGADARCADKYPEVRSALGRALSMLARDPQDLRMAGLATDGKPVQVRFDAAMLARTLRTMISGRGSSGEMWTPAAVPALLDLVTSGRLVELAPTLAELVAGEQPFCLGYQPKCELHHPAVAGVVYSVLCHDLGPVTGPIETTGNGFREAYARSPYLDVCDAWAVEPTASDAPVRQPLETDVPTLVTTGRYATFAPEQLVRDGFRGARDLTVVVDPLAGHNVIAGTECLLDIRNQWLDDLTLDDDTLACVDELRMNWVRDPDRLIIPGATADEAG